MFCNIYDKVANELFGHTANEIRQLRESGQDSVIADLLAESKLKEYKFRIMSK